MKSRDILTLIGHTESRYLTPIANEADRPRTRRPGKPHLLLIAAIVALTALLVGCTAAFLIHAKDIQLGRQTITLPVLNEEGIPDSTETLHEKVFSLAGWEGTKEYQASKEWFDFMQTYDTDYAIKTAFTKAYGENGSAAIDGFPEEYLLVYDVYSREMASELDYLLDKYDLKAMALSDGATYYPPEDCTPMIPKITGTDFFLPDAGISLNTQTNDTFIGAAEDNSIFLSCRATVNGIESEFGCEIYYVPLGYFNPGWFSMAQEDRWTEHNYTTKNGDEVLVLHAGDGLYSEILCFREDGIISARIESRLEFFTSDGNGKDYIDVMILTPEQLDAIADTINWKLQPAPDMELCHSESKRSDAIWDDLMAKAHADD